MCLLDFYLNGVFYIKACILKRIVFSIVLDRNFSSIHKHISYIHNYHLDLQVKILSIID